MSQERWIPLVDGPIGHVVARIQEENPELDELVSSPHRLLAFRTFAYIRVGLILGELLVDQELDADADANTWVEQLLNNPEHREAVTAEVRAIAEEIAADPGYTDEEPLGPDEETRRRFRDFARRRLDVS